ncbi:hypothetical protein [Paraburkholderia tropica]|uniref:hypothetical protein n=1 Tax=Paraburkholderia tropica TaxID=92647 RepID=UPI003D2E070A
MPETKIKIKKIVPKHIKRVEVWLLTELHEQLKTLSMQLGSSMSELLADQVRTILLNHREKVATVSGKFHISQEQYDAYLDGTLSHSNLVDIERCAISSEAHVQSVEPEDVGIEAPTPEAFPFPKSGPEEAVSELVTTDVAIVQNDVELASNVEALETAAVVDARVDINETVATEQQPIQDAVIEGEASTGATEQEVVMDKAVDNDPAAPLEEVSTAEVPASPAMASEPLPTTGITTTTAEPENEEEKPGIGSMVKAWFSGKNK